MTHYIILYCVSQYCDDPFDELRAGDDPLKFQLLSQPEWFWNRIVAVDGFPSRKESGDALLDLFLSPLMDVWAVGEIATEFEKLQPVLESECGNRIGEPQGFAESMRLSNLSIFERSNRQTRTV